MARFLAVLVACGTVGGCAGGSADPAATASVNLEVYDGETVNIDSLAVGCLDVSYAAAEEYAITAGFDHAGGLLLESGEVDQHDLAGIRGSMVFDWVAATGQFDKDPELADLVDYWVEKFSTPVAEMEVLDVGPNGGYRLVRAASLGATGTDVRGSWIAAEEELKDYGSARWYADDDQFMNAGTVCSSGKSPESTQSSSEASVQ